MRFRAQGATEYLVLLAVVLVIALVGIALLGFFPGAASDAQIAESQIYWAGQSPIAITEWNARAAYGTVYPYLRMRNTGAYPVRITGLIGADGSKVTVFWGDAGVCGFPASSEYSISNYFYMAPGEEKYFSRGPGMFGTPCEYDIKFSTGASTGSVVGGATSVCQNSTTSPGTVVLNSFGFEYIQYVEGQQITKRQSGAKPLIIKCREPYY